MRIGTGYLGVVSEHGRASKMTVPLCKCGAPCKEYSVGQFSVKCEVCNEINAIRQRLARRTNRRPLGFLAWRIAKGKEKMP